MDFRETPVQLAPNLQLQVLSEGLLPHSRLPSNLTFPWALGHSLLPALDTSAWSRFHHCQIHPSFHSLSHTLNTHTWLCHFCGFLLPKSKLFNVIHKAH